MVLSAPSMDLQGNHEVKISFIIILISLTVQKDWRVKLLARSMTQDCGAVSFTDKACGFT